MARNVVDLPAPEGPTSASSSPSLQENSTASGIGPACLSVTWSPASTMPATDAAREHVGDGERNEREKQQQRRHDAGTVLIEGLHPVVDGDRDRFRFAGNAAAHHQHNAEFAQRV